MFDSFFWQSRASPLLTQYSIHPQFKVCIYEFEVSLPATMSYCSQNDSWKDLFSVHAMVTNALLLSIVQRCLVQCGYLLSWLLLLVSSSDWSQACSLAVQYVVCVVLSTPSFLVLQNILWRDNYPRHGSSLRMIVCPAREDCISSFHEMSFDEFES